MSELKQELPGQKRKRYPGARPFSDSLEDQQIFFGRDADIDRLFERVIGSKLLVLFGKSGLGKTSLLRAGLFPKLGKEKPFLPIPIRVNTPESPTNIIISAIVQACKDAGADLTTGDQAGVWEFLCSSLIWSNDLLLTPVLVLDQFEEIFTLRDSKFRAEIASELGALVSGIPPERLRSARDSRSDRAVPANEKPPEVKILLSLREEYLGALQELSNQIPGLFQERYRLSPLNESDAKSAICGPAASVAGPQDAPFASPVFEYDAEALKELLGFLRGRSGIIEPFQLQLLCCRAEEIVEAKMAELTVRRTAWPTTLAINNADEPPPMFEITRADLGGPTGMGDVLRQFYRRVINKLGWRDRRRARRLCEEGMLSATGNRIMLEQAQIQSEYGLPGPALKILVDERLLRCEQHLESLFYELSHDRLAESIEHNRPFRIPRKLRQGLAGAAVVGLGTIGALFYWNHEIQQARLQAEELVSFLIGEDFLEKLRPVGSNAILTVVQGEVESFLSVAPDQSGFGHRRIEALALRNAGAILKSQGKVDEAILKFRESAEVFEGLAATRAAIKAEQARSLNMLGDALSDQGKITGALEVHQKALAILSELYEIKDPRPEIMIELADSNTSVGQDLSEMGKPQQAIARFDRARELLKSIEASGPRSPKLLSVLHNTIDSRASSLSLLGDDQGAKNGYAQAKNITDEWLAQSPLSADARSKQILAVSRVANQQMSRGAAKQALVQYQQIHQQVDELTRWDETNANWRRDSAATLILEADGLKGNKQYDGAAQSYDIALKKLTDLAQAKQTNLSLKKDLHWVYEARGLLAFERKQWTQAVEDLAAAEKFIADASTIDYGHATWRREWAYTCFNLADAKAHAGESWSPEAIDSLRRGRSILAALIKAVPEMTVLYGDLAYFYQQEILALKKIGKEAEVAALSREALESGRRGIDEIKHAAESYPQNVSWWNYLATEYDVVAKLLEDGGNSRGALAAYVSASAALQRAGKLDPDTPIYPDRMYDDYARIAKLQQTLGDAAGAESALSAAADASQRALELGKSAIYAKRAAAASERLGRFYKDAGSQDKALPAYEQASKNAGRATELDQNDEYSFWQASGIHRDTGLLREKAGGAKEARADYRSAIAAGQRAVGLKPGDGENWRVLYLAQWFLAANIRGSEDKAAAIILFRDALQNAQNAAERLPEDQDIKKHVTSLQAEVEKS
jgi:tetratricopeptide (TPR) repeat protein